MQIKENIKLNIKLNIKKLFYIVILFFYFMFYITPDLFARGLIIFPNGGLLFSKYSKKMGYAAGLGMKYSFVSDLYLVGNGYFLSQKPNNSGNIKGRAFDLGVGIDVPVFTKTYVSIFGGGSYLNYSDKLYSYVASYGLSYYLYPKFGLELAHKMRYKPGKGVLTQQVIFGLNIKLFAPGSGFGEDVGLSGSDGSAVSAYAKLRQDRGAEILALKNGLCVDFDCDAINNTIETSNLSLLNQHKDELAKFMQSTNTKLIINIINNKDNNKYQKRLRRAYIMKDYLINHIGLSPNRIDVIFRSKL